MKRREDPIANLLAQERGGVFRPSPRGLRLVMAYPNTYHVGMSSLGFQMVARLAAESGAAQVERAFADLPPVGMETGLPLAGADVVAFSVAFELDFVGLAAMLRAAEIPLMARRRGPGWPLVVAGGTAIQLNRHAIYDVCDVFVHGAGEPVIGPLVEICDRRRSDRPALLAELAHLPGVEITAGAQVAAGIDLGVAVAGEGTWSAADAADPARAPRIASPAPNGIDQLDPWPGHSVILTPETEFSDRMLVELSRGCCHHCTFCWSGHNIQPYTVRSLDAVLAILRQGMEETGKFGLVSAAVGAHPDIDAICAFCDRHDLNISFSSLRVEDVTEAMLATLVRSGQKSITLAPESAAPRLQRLLGKDIGEERLSAVIEQAVALGMRDVKLYFMIGLPTETDDEAMEIVGFLERLRDRYVHVSRGQGQIGTMTVNLGVYVPHPDTPLTRVGPPPELRQVRRRLKALVQRLGKAPNTRVNATGVEYAQAQTALCNGDRGAWALVRQALETGHSWRRILRDH